MQKLRILYLLGFVVSFTITQAQTNTPNSREPEKKRVYHSPAKAKTSKSNKKKITHTKEYEFYERVENAAREKQRLLKKLSKAQFSDHRHFGHKRLPKRRIANKMRYCNECGIRH
ncbi:hypothetical protein BH09BAC3_BH09BAC3_21630 [soil metagenome]